MYQRPTASLRLHFVRHNAGGLVPVGKLVDTLISYITHFCFTSERRADLSEQARNRAYLEAKRLFRNDPNTGQPGELLVYFFIEAVLQAPQVLKKMLITTNPNDERKGSDGVHVRWPVNEELLEVIFAEAKLHKNFAAALTSAFTSMTDFHNSATKSLEINYFLNTCNFPARRLLLDANFGLKKISDPFVELESAVREEENKFEDTPEGVTLTDFQVRLLNALRAKSSVSVSAPTSAGKSYTLELDLLHRLKESSSYTGIFLVPTRALIQQVSMDLADLMRNNNVECSVLSSLSMPEDDRQVTRKLIFVFTQERFATFLAQAPPTVNIDSIVVDEAPHLHFWG